MEQPLKCRRRKIGSARFGVNVDVQFSSPSPEGIEGIGVVRNLSMRGALIETHALLTTDDQLTVYRDASKPGRSIGNTHRRRSVGKRPSTGC